MRAVLDMAAKYRSMVTVGRCAHAAAGALALAAVLSGPVRADPLLDFGLFDVPSQAQLAMKNPLVRWQVRPDAETACTHASPKDGFASRQEGCVYWHLASSTCTIVTTGSTTHSQMGHLFLRCLQGK